MKKKFKTGKVDLPKDEFDSKHAKIRISLLIDGDVLQAYKEAAKRTPHGEYQTLMKEKLREAIFGKYIDPEFRDLIGDIVREEIKKVG